MFVQVFCIGLLILAFGALWHVKTMHRTDRLRDAVILPYTVGATLIVTSVLYGIVLLVGKAFT